MTEAMCTSYCTVDTRAHTLASRDIKPVLENEIKAFNKEPS